MSSAPQSTRSLGAVLSAIWADIDHGQKRHRLLNRPWAQTAQHSAKPPFDDQSGGRS